MESVLSTDKPRTHRDKRALTLQSPVIAMLWEHWRAYRWSLLFFLSLEITVGTIWSLIIVDLSAGKDYLGVLAALSVMALLPFFAIGRYFDAGNPGQAGFSHPVPTWILVVTPMFFAGVLAAVSYLIPTIYLITLLGLPPFPLVSVAMSIAVAGIVYIALHWSTNNILFRAAALFALAYGGYTFVRIYLNPYGPGGLGEDFLLSGPEVFNFSFLEYGVLIVVMLMASALAIAGVERQRHGDSFSLRGLGKPQSSATLLLDWLRPDCPTNSTIRAQCWYEFQVRSWQVLGVGIFYAVIILLLTTFDRKTGSLLELILMLLAFVMLFGGANVFGITLKKNKAYLSSFIATRAMSSASLAAIKVVITVLAVVSSQILIVAFLWFAGPYFSDAFSEVKPEFVALFDQVPGYLFIPLIGFYLVQLTAIVVCMSTIVMFITYYPKRAGIATTVTALLSVAIGFLVALQRDGLAAIEESEIVTLQKDGFMLIYWTGTASEIAIKTIAWTIFLLIPVVIVYLSRSLLQGLVLSLKKLIIVLLIWVLYMLMYFTVTHSIVSAGTIGWWITPALLPLLAFLFAPWVVNHIRHR